MRRSTCHNRVLPTTSLNKNVSVPEGLALMCVSRIDAATLLGALCPGRIAGWAAGASRTAGPGAIREQVVGGLSAWWLLRTERWC